MEYLSQENVYNALQRSGLIGNQNYYFNGFVLPSAGQYALLGTFAGVLNSFSGYLINITERGLGILPIASSNGDFVYEKAVILPYQYIARVEATNGGLFAYKNISIITVNNEKISFKVTKRVLPNPNHMNNVNYFLRMYNAL